MRYVIKLSNPSTKYNKKCIIFSGEGTKKNGTEIGEAWTLVDTQHGLPTAEVGRLSHSVPGRGTTRARQIYH